MCVMKLNKYFMMGAMGLSLVACSDNLDENGQGANGTNPNEGTTYVAFTVDFKGTESRVVDESGTASERNVTSAYVLLVDNGTISSVVSKDDVVASGEGYHSTEDKYLFQTTEGNHSFYAVINPTGDIPAEGESIAEYFGTAVSLAVDNGVAAANNFMMSSTEEVVANVQDNITEDEALTGTNETKNNFKVVVERVAAKVTVSAENATITDSKTDDGDASGQISGTTFDLWNGAEKTYRMAQPTYIVDNTFGYYKKGTSVYMGAYNADDVTPAYCLENLHATSEYKQGNTTYINISTTFTPSKVVDCADEIKPLKDNSTKGTFYVVTRGELSNNYIMDADLQKYRTDKSDQSILPAGVEALSAPYTDGKCWFGPIWVGQEKQGEDSYAPVARNTWYALQIKSISLPGDPEEPEIKDPEWPLEPPTNVAITLEVKKWTLKPINVDLN